MADVTVTVHTSLEADCDAAVLASFANPDSLSAADLTKQVLENYLTGIINAYYEKTDVDAARASATKITDLETGATA